MANAQRLPIHNFHAEHGARFVYFGGWEMPLQYSSILEEHTAVRETAGLFDVSHMGEFQITGHEAARFLDKLVVNSIAKAPDGKAIYSPMCLRNGGIVDDLIVYRTSKESFLVCVNASNLEKDYGWFHKQADQWNMDVEIENHSESYALFAVQGPRAEAILVAAGFKEATGLKRFWHKAVNFMGERCRIARTGYTGEDGFEIYVPITATLKLAELLVKKGEPHGLKLCGLGARDSLRLEAGLPLYGHELTEEITPLEAGLEWTVKFQKEDFIGKTALSEQKQIGVPRRLIHFKLEGRRIAREGTAVVNENGNTIGKILSGTKSPGLNCPIGSAFVNTKALNGPLFVNLRGNMVVLQIAKPPLHKS